MGMKRASLIRALAKVLCGAYPRWQATEQTWEVFARVLQDLDEDCVLAAAWDWVGRETKEPTPADLKKRAQAKVRYLEQGADNPWLEVRIGTLRVGYSPDKLALLENQEGEAATAERQRIREQTKHTVSEHLETIRKHFAGEKEKRRALIRKQARGAELEEDLVGEGSTVKVAKG